MLSVDGGLYLRGVGNTPQKSSVFHKNISLRKIRVWDLAEQTRESEWRFDLRVPRISKRSKESLMGCMDWNIPQVGMYLNGNGRNRG